MTALLHFSRTAGAAAFLAVVLVALALGGPPAVAQPSSTDVDLPAPRLFGADRQETSAVLQANVPASDNPSTASTVVIVSETSTATALAASGLVGATDAALLVAGATVSAAVVAIVDDLAPSEVIVVGGSAAFADRWSASDRILTHVTQPGGEAAIAAAVTRELRERLPDPDPGTPRPALLVSSSGLADGVAAAPLAHERRLPLLLTGPAGLDPHARFTIRNEGLTHITVLGGEAVISPAIVAELADMGVTVDRLGGANREETALQVAERRGLDLSRVLLAAGDPAVDAVTAGPLAARTGAAVLPPGATTRLALARTCGAGTVVQVVGGPAVISPAVEGQHRAAVERCGDADQAMQLRVAIAAPDDPLAPAAAAEVLADERGWSSRRVRVVAVGADHTLGLIISADGCGGLMLCRRGRNIVIDAGAWRDANPDGRTRLINLSVGHRLGEAIDGACGSGVMQAPQCPGPSPVWPSDAERTAVADRFIPRARLAFTGDIHAERHIAAAAVNGDNPLVHVSGVLADADLAIVNLETPLSTRGQPVPKTYNFRGPPAMAARLVEAGVDVASLANNHALDYGPVAMFDTLAHTAAAGLATVGAGADAAAAYAPVIADTPAGTVAVIGLTRVLHTRTWEATADRAGLASAYDEAGAVGAVQQAALMADHVVVAIHWGSERADCPNGDQRRLARLLVDAGADVIVGHHPHVLQGIHVLDGSLIANSLGNFVWYHNRAPSRYTGILEVELPLLRDPEWTFTPAEIGADGFPRLATGALGAAITARVRDRSPGGTMRCGFAS